MRDRIALNEGRPCSCSGCDQPRTAGTGSPYCSMHRDRRMRYGHPEASALPRRVTQGARRFTKRICSSPSNADRVVLIDALGAIKARLNAAVFNPRPNKTDRMLVARSVNRSQDPMDILSSVAGTLLWLAVNPKHPAVPDLQAEDYCVARAWLMADYQSGKPRPTKTDPSSTALCDLGSWCRTQLAPLVAALRVAWEAASHRRKPARDPHRPFDLKRPRGSGRPRGV
jgi:hypothetical protein